MTGWICDVPLPHNVTPVLHATDTDLDAECRRLGAVVMWSYPDDGFRASVWDRHIAERLVVASSSSRAGVLAKAVGELRRL